MTSVTATAPELQPAAYHTSWTRTKQRPVLRRHVRADFLRHYTKAMGNLKEAGHTQGHVQQAGVEIGLWRHHKNGKKSQHREDPTIATTRSSSRFHRMLARTLHLQPCHHSHVTRQRVLRIQATRPASSNVDHATVAVNPVIAVKTHVGRPNVHELVVVPVHNASMHDVWNATRGARARQARR